MKRIYFLLLFALYSVMAIAQEGSGGADLNVNVTKTTEGGSSIPWLWIIGGIVVLVLLVALLRGGGTDRVVEKRTVVKD